MEPLFITLPVARALAGVGRSTLYRALIRGDVRARKAGRRTLIERASLEAWLRSLPTATFAPPPTQPVPARAAKKGAA